jgi:segregation and condensation protein A
MANRVPINIRVDRFEGPLDLLLYLIQSHELDVSKIAISRITDQYLAYVRLMQELDFDIASDFLVMAATLIQWKSKSLLPVEVDPNALLLGDDDSLSPEDLLRQLMEHQRFLDAGQELARLPLLGEDVYQRPMTRKVTEKVWKSMDVSSLAFTFQDLLVKERKRTTILKKETVSLSEKIMDFSERMEVGRVVGMKSLLRDLNSRPETVVTFLASLELGRLKKMRLHQEKTYEEIYVELLESIKGFDTELARGFDAVEAQVEKGIADAASHGEGHAASTAAAAALGINPSDAPPGINALRAGTEIQLADERGVPASDAGVDGTSVESSDFDRTSPPDAGDNRTSVESSDLAGAEDSSSDGDSAGAGLAGLDSDAGDSVSGSHGIDLASFGESPEPDLRAVLSGHSRIDRGDHAPSDGTDEHAGSPADGRRNAARDSERNADDERGRHES